MSFFHEAFFESYFIVGAGAVAAVPIDDENNVVVIIVVVAAAADFALFSFRFQPLTNPSTPS